MSDVRSTLIIVLACVVVGIVVGAGLIFGGFSPKVTTAVTGDVCREFAPREDITAWEVARVLQGIHGAASSRGIFFTPAQWDAVPPHLKLQFKEC